jgi:hypothetical protein
MKRAWHPYWEWECIAAGFYDGSNGDEAGRYEWFFRDLARFSAAIDRVFNEWPISCEQFLANESMNRVAWLGQAAIFLSEGVPRSHRNEYLLLLDHEQQAANRLAQRRIEEWFHEYEAAGAGIHRNVAIAWVSGRHTGRGAGRANAGEAGPVVQGYLFRLTEQ